MTIHIQEKNLQVLSKGPMRIVRIENFLERANRDRLFRTICEEQKSFKTPNGQEESTSRMLTIGDHGMFEAKSAALESMTDLLSDKIIDCLPEAFHLLNVPEFQPSKLTFSLIHGLNGHYTDIHQDVSDNNMKLTALYYLRNDPGSFTGGHLQLFPSKNIPDSRKDYMEGNLIDIPPDDNTLLIFLSEIYHHVTPVISNSDKFEDGRFNATAFI